MRGRAALLAAFVFAAVPAGDAAQAQLSPEGIIGGLTRPLRQMLGHHPRHHRHHARPAAARATASPREAAVNETPADTSIRLGRAGPAAWPSAYEEVIGFSLWPDDYATRIRGRGFDVIADTISGRFQPPRQIARAATTGAAAKTDGVGEATARCSDPGPASDDWPSTRLEQILQLSNAEHDSLGKLQATVNQSSSGLRSACQNAGELGAPDRLRALVQMLWMVRDGGIALRAPLHQFYDSLTDVQKNNLTNGPVKTIARAGSGAPDSADKQQQVCAAQNIGSAERLIKEIEMKVRPNKTQAASLENLHKVATGMAKLLIASCAQPIATDPAVRLDSADDQLTAMNYAATNVQLALDDFYGKLSGVQKARLDSAGR